MPDDGPGAWLGIVRYGSALLECLIAFGAVLSAAAAVPVLALFLGQMSASPARSGVDHSCNDGTSRGADLEGCAIICARLRVLELHSARDPNPHQI